MPDESLDNLLLGDPTCLTSTFLGFQSAKERLLENITRLDHTEMAVTDRQVARFKARHGHAPYPCRRAQCERSLVGFSTIEERAEHERNHMSKLYCSDSKCEFAQLGFSSRLALSRHIRTYHTDIKDIDVPPLPGTQDSHMPRPAMDVPPTNKSPTDVSPSGVFGDGSNDILDGFDFENFLKTETAEQEEQAFDFSTFPGMGDNSPWCPPYSPQQQMKLYTPR